MANICINRFYCSTNSEANYEKIMYALDEEFDLYGLDGRDAPEAFSFART